MVVKNSKFVISAVSPKQYPEGDLLEIAFAGRSNVGKSSLINALVNRKDLAYSGSRQGMTRMINFYNINNEIHFVDLPGYGFAMRAKSELDLWGKVIEQYLNVRDRLYLMIMLVDIRHKPSADDVKMYNWILASGLEYIVVATKTDKLSKMQVKENIKLIKKTLDMPDDMPVYPVSAEKKTGIPELWKAIDNVITEEEEE